ncbi:hypothetical protein [Dyella silvatica]|nr:hypothetical protein [Dyella silvatica]
MIIAAAQAEAEVRRLVITGADTRLVVAADAGREVAAPAAHL